MKKLEYATIPELTDAAPTVTRIVKCSDVASINVFVTSDKGATVTITPLPVEYDISIEGPVSETLTIANGGETSVAAYSNIGSPKAKIVATKTETGSTSGFSLTITGGE